MGGRGSNSKNKGGGNLLGKAAPDVNPRNIKDLLANKAKYPDEATEIMEVSRRLTNLYGDDGVITQFQTATMPGAYAYYDSNGNIAFNNKYMDTTAMNASFDAGVKEGFHPSRGNKTGLEATAAHEFGHALTDKAAQKMGKSSLEDAARDIVESARKKTSHKTNLSMAKNISGYAQYNFAECVAEAFGDWYCNGSNAKKESRAIVAVLNSRVRKGGK